MHPLDQADAPESVLSVGGTPGGMGARHSPWAGVCALASATRAVAAARGGPAPPPSTVADAALFAHAIRQLAADGDARVAVAARAGVPRGRAATLLRHSLVARLFWDGALGGAVEGRRGPVATFVGTLVGAVAGQAAGEGGGGGGGGTPHASPPPPPPPTASFVDATAAAAAAADALRTLSHVASAAEAAGAFHASRPVQGGGACGGSARAALDSALSSALFPPTATVRGPAALTAGLAALHPRDARRLVTLEAARRCGHRAGAWSAALDGAAAHAAAPWTAATYVDGAAAPSLEALAADAGAGGAGALALGGGEWGGVAAVVAAAAVAGAAVAAAGAAAADDPRGPLPADDADAFDGGARLVAAIEAAVAAVAARAGGGDGVDASLALARCAASMVRGAP